MTKFQEKIIDYCLDTRQLSENEFKSGLNNLIGNNIVVPTPTNDEDVLKAYSTNNQIMDEKVQFINDIFQKHSVTGSTVAQAMDDVIKSGKISILDVFIMLQQSNAMLTTVLKLNGLGGKL